MPFRSRQTLLILVVVLFTLLLATESIACSWDYLIWQPRHRNSSPYFRFIKDGKAGYIDSSGKVVIPPTLTTYGNGDRGVISGVIRIDSDKYLNLLTEKESDEENYLRKLNTIEGFRLELKDGSSFFVDEEGERLGEKRFLLARDFSEGLAAVVMKGPCSYYDTRSICPSAGIDLPQGTNEEVLEACKFGFLNRAGGVAIAPRFLDAGRFSEGLAPVLVSSGWGYVNTEGLMAIAPQFEDAEPFSDGLGMVRLDRKVGFVNRLGVMIIPPTYRFAEPFSDELAPVLATKNGGKERYFYINTEGNRINDKQYLLASRYFEGIAHVQTDCKKIEKDVEGDKEDFLQARFAYIDLNGNEIFSYFTEDERDDCPM